MMVVLPGGYGISAIFGRAGAAGTSCAGAESGGAASAGGSDGPGASGGGASAGGSDGPGACASSLRVADWRRGDPGPRGGRLSRCPGSPRRCAPRDDGEVVVFVTFSPGGGAPSAAGSTRSRW